MWSAWRSLNRSRRVPDLRFCACALCAGQGHRVAPHPYPWEGTVVNPWFGIVHRFVFDTRPPRWEL
ncbi:protein of unknown function [Streptomyces sp. KY70]|nr:protein of unknown function [Streptomyces sp. KY70]